MKKIICTTAIIVLFLMGSKPLKSLHGSYTTHQVETTSDVAWDTFFKFSGNNRPSLSLQFQRNNSVTYSDNFGNENLTGTYQYDGNTLTLLLSTDTIHFTVQQYSKQELILTRELTHAETAQLIPQLIPQEHLVYSSDSSSATSTLTMTTVSSNMGANFDSVLTRSINNALSHIQFSPTATATSHTITLLNDSIIYDHTDTTNNNLRITYHLLKQ